MLNGRLRFFTTLPNCNYPLKNLAIQIPNEDRTRKFWKQIDMKRIIDLSSQLFLSCLLSSLSLLLIQGMPLFSFLVRDSRFKIFSPRIVRVARIKNYDGFKNFHLSPLFFLSVAAVENFRLNLWAFCGLSFHECVLRWIRLFEFIYFIRIYDQKVGNFGMLKLFFILL